MLSARDSDGDGGSSDRNGASMGMGMTASMTSWTGSSTSYRQRSDI